MLPCHDYDYSHKEFLGLTLKDIRPPEDVPTILKYCAPFVARRLPQGRPGRHFACCKKGRHLDQYEIKWTSISFQGRQASLVMLNDVTERKRTDTECRAFQTRPPAQFGNSPEASQVIKAVADNYSAGTLLQFNLYSAEHNRALETLNIDTDRYRPTFQIPVTGQRREPQPHGSRDHRARGGAGPAPTARYQTSCDSDRRHFAALLP